MIIFSKSIRHLLTYGNACRKAAGLCLRRK